MYTVVLDDDPTGTQSATDVTVLLRWDEASLTEILGEHRSVYLQTNSRAIPEDRARDLAGLVRSQVAKAERSLGQPVLVVLRGDSTLRGHVFAESDVFAGDDGRILFCPAFPAGGRTTVNSVHRVVIDGRAIPVAETEFAKDPVFGYVSSHLREWVSEKGRRSSVAVPLTALRVTDGHAVAQALAEAGPREVVVPDAETDDDLVLIERGLREAVEHGVHVVVRSGATLAAICADRLSSGYLSRPVPVAETPLLIVCGSHTQAATEQLERLVVVKGARPVVVSTDEAFADPEAAGARAAIELGRQMRASGFAILSTERNRRPEDNTLTHGELVMRALMEAAGRAVTGPATVVSKGGITSAEVARIFFGADRATVRGQLAPGISVWDYAGGRRGGTQVIVPGNVGSREALVDAIGALLTQAGERL